MSEDNIEQLQRRPHFFEHARPESFGLSLGGECFGKSWASSSIGCQSPVVSPRERLPEVISRSRGRSNAPRRRLPRRMCPGELSSVGYWHTDSIRGGRTRAGLRLSNLPTIPGRSPGSGSPAECLRPAGGRRSAPRSRNRRPPRPPGSSASGVAGFSGQLAHFQGKAATKALSSKIKTSIKNLKFTQNGPYA